MLKQMVNYPLKYIKEHSCKLPIKLFNSSIPKLDSEDNKECIELNKYFKIEVNKLQEDKIQINILESIIKKSSSIILSDDYSNRKFMCALGMMNKIINDKNKSEEVKESQPENENEEFFANSLEVFTQNQDKADENLEKKKLAPRGALVICQKFEFVTNFYKMCRLLDHEKKLRLVRLGTSLHSVSPTVDLDPKQMTESDEYESHELMMGNVNLINTTLWNNIDFLFITPPMLKFVLEQKDDFDYYDINPEIVLIEDFDYMLNSEKFDLKSVLKRFFSEESNFPAEHNKKRKLILSSSTIQAVDPKDNAKFIQELSASIEVYKGLMQKWNLTIDMIDNLDVVLSPNFMNLDFHLKGLQVVIQTIEEDEEDSTLVERKLNHLIQLIEKKEGSMVICCADANVSLIRDNLRKNKIRCVSVEEGDKIGNRLYSIMVYNSHNYDCNILIISPVILKGLTLNHLQSLVVFDFVQDKRTFIRILSKFPLRSDNSTSFSLNLMCTNAEMEKNKELLDSINTHKISSNTN